MPVNLGRFARPRTASIFASDPATLGKVVTFILTDVAVPVPNRVRLDLLRRTNVSRPTEAARSPVERVVVDNLRRPPERVSLTGSLSATPLGIVATRLGGFGSIIRRDLRELEKLRRIQDRREPVVLVLPYRVYSSMAMSIDEDHDGTNKVELALTFEEIRIVSPLSVTGALDLDTILGGAQSQSNMGSQSGQIVSAPTGVAGGLG